MFVFFSFDSDVEMVFAVKTPNDLVRLRKKGLRDPVLMNPIDGGHNGAYDIRTRVSTALG